MIPDNAEIYNATFSLYCFNDEEPTASTKASLFLVREKWDQKSATWYKRTAQENWSTQGGTFDESDIIAEKNFSANGSNKWEDYTVTSAIKKFQKEPDKNYGFLLACFEKDKHHYRSSEYSSDKAKRPKLSIKYGIGTPIVHQSKAQKTIYPFKIQHGSNTITINSTMHYPYSIRAINVKGEQVFFRKNATKNVIINKALFSSGMYLLSIKANQVIYNECFIVQ